MSEELRQQAMRRLQEKELLERHTASEQAKSEADKRRRQVEESEARAEELRQKTRQRMQHYTRQQREQCMAQEEVASAVLS